MGYFAILVFNVLQIVHFIDKYLADEHVCYPGEVTPMDKWEPSAWNEIMDAFRDISKILLQEDATASNVDSNNIDTKRFRHTYSALFFQEKTRAEILIVRDFLINSINESEGERQAALCLVGTCCAHILHGNRPYALSRRSHNVIPIPPKGEFEYKSLIKSLKENQLKEKLNKQKRVNTKRKKISERRKKTRRTKEE